MEAVPLCEPWPVSGCADLSPYPADITGVGFMAASEILWAASGRQYGVCSIDFRPCSRACLEQPYGGWWWHPGGWINGWPYGPMHGGWINAVCGTCQGACSCNDADTLRLPFPAQAVTEVSVDGTPLPASGYVLYNGDILVRADGARWPFCQDWTQTSGTGVFRITATFGEEVPAIGTLAMGEVLPEVLKGCVPGGECRLPSGLVESINRQGVSKTFVSTVALKEQGLSGLHALPLTSRFLEFANPSHLTHGGMKVWNPDDWDEGPRREGAMWP